MHSPRRWAAWSFLFLTTAFSCTQEPDVDKESDFFATDSKETCFLSWREYNNRFYTWSRTFAYDAEDRVHKITEGGPQFGGYSVFTYNPDGQPVRKQAYTAGGDSASYVIYEYEGQRLVKETLYTKSLFCCENTHYFYNANGLLSEHHWFPAHKPDRRHRYTYQYDSRGLISAVEVWNVFSPDDVDETQTYQYGPKVVKTISETGELQLSNPVKIVSKRTEKTFEYETNAAGYALKITEITKDLYSQAVDTVVTNSTYLCKP